MKNYKIELSSIELHSLLLCVGFTCYKSETELSEVAQSLYRKIEKQTLQKDK